MSSMLDIHAGGRRHLAQTMYKMDCFIHGLAPPLCNAKPLMRAGLDMHFDGNDWHFNHTSTRGQGALAARGGRSLVLTSRSALACKLPLLAGKCTCVTCAMPV